MITIEMLRGVHGIFFGKVNSGIAIDPNTLPIGGTFGEVSGPPPPSGSEPRPAQIWLGKYLQNSNSLKQGMFGIK